MEKTYLKNYLRTLNEQENPSDSLIVGKHNDTPDSEFDPEQFKIGMQVESEHSNNPKIQAAIVKDHLSEIKDYYTRLQKMESEAKGGGR